MSNFPIAFIYILGAIIILLLPGRLRAAFFLLVAAAAFYVLVNLQMGATLTVPFLSYELVLTRVDGLSRVFGYVMVGMSFLGGVYAFHIKDRLQQFAALAYVGSALGVVFAGDLFTVLVYWEIMALTSMLLILARRTPESRRAGFRYLLVHAFGGSLLMAGIILHLSQTGSLAFGLFDGGVAGWLVMLAFAVNAAIPPLNAWMPDAYPEATVTGTVFLSAFTSKTAVYALARGFAGHEVLIWVGVVMALYGTVYALMQNDIRRLLAYSIIAQIGYMVVAIGIGTDAGINGASAHAFTHILYKALLLMAAGTVLYSTGRSKLTQLGGLSKALPAVLVFYAVGAMAISGFPLFSGFVSKSIILQAVHHEHLTIVVILLSVATLGTFLHTGLKLPYYTWFSEPKEPVKAAPVPVNQYIGMALTAIPCVAIGVYPPLLLNLLPYPVEGHMYTASHVLESLQLLVLAAVAFWAIKGWLRGRDKTVLDTDWFYRRPSRVLFTVCSVWVHEAFVWCGDASLAAVNWVVRLGANPLGTLERLRYAFAPSGGKGRETPPYNPDRYRIPLGIMLLVVMAFFVVLLAWVFFHN